MMPLKSGTPAPGRSLATLTLVAVTAIVLVQIISGGLQLAANLSAQEALVTLTQQQLAHGASDTVTTFVEIQFTTLETAVGMHDSSPWDGRLESLIAVQPGFRHVAALDDQNAVAAVASRISRESAAQFFHELPPDTLLAATTRQRSVSPVFIDQASGEPQVVLAVPITDATGTRIGTLLADVNLKVMWDVIERLKVGQTGYAYVVDRQGRLLAFRDTARVLKGERLGALQPVAQFQAGQMPAEQPATSTYTGLGGAPVVGTVTPLGTPDWAVVVELPVDEAYAGLRQTLLAAAGVLVATTLLAGVGSVLLARGITRPLVSLMESAARIASGERDVQAAVRGPREVARLAAAFNSMSAQLRVTLDTLEATVAQRTSDLSRAVTELQRRADEQRLLLEQNARQREALRELGAPILPVTEDTLVLPLVGDFSPERLADARDRALEAVARTRARRLLLDVTGVPLIDSQVAQGLVGLAVAARLLGAEAVLIGIRPEVAQTIVGLGLDLSSFGTAADLQSALVELPAGRHAGA